jgi:hypothetical protein
MKHATILLAMAAITLAAGCHHDDQAPQGADTASTAQQRPVSSAASHPPVDVPQQEKHGPRIITSAPPPAQNPHAARDIPTFPLTGVSACDTYAEVVRQCLNVHTYGINRLNLRSEFAKAAKGWKKSAGAGTVDATVAQQCTAFRNAFRTKLQAVGCTGV